MGQVASVVSALLDLLGFSGDQLPLNATLVVIGLDNAGKTTLLHRMRTGEFRQFVPTERAMPHAGEGFVVEAGGGVGGGGTVSFCAWDLGGHEAVRHLWEDYIYADATKCQGIIFCVDAADVPRMAEARDELVELVAALADHREADTVAADRGGGDSKLKVTRR